METIASHFLFVQHSEQRRGVVSGTAYTPPKGLGRLGVPRRKGKEGGRKSSTGSSGAGCNRLVREAKGDVSQLEGF